MTLHLPTSLNFSRRGLGSLDKGSVGESRANLALIDHFNKNNLEYYDLNVMKDANARGSDFAFIVKNPEDKQWELLIGDGKDYSKLNVSDFQNLNDRKEEWLTDLFTKNQLLESPDMIISGFTPDINQLGLSQEELNMMSMAEKQDLMVQNKINELIEQGRVNVVAASTDAHLNPEQAEILNKNGYQYIRVEDDGQLETTGEKEPSESMIEGRELDQRESETDLPITDTEESYGENMDSEDVNVNQGLDLSEDEDSPVISGEEYGDELDADSANPEIQRPLDDSIDNGADQPVINSPIDRSQDGMTGVDEVNTNVQVESNPEPSMNPAPEPPPIESQNFG
jgi:hypothetical protein